MTTRTLPLAPGRASRRQRGVTLTELLVVILIIGLLAAIAIPVYTARSENAKVAVANAECREIAEAEEQCALIHGFYVPFQVLDDTADQFANSGSTGISTPNYYDSIGRESTSIFVVNPLISALTQQGNQGNLGYHLGLNANGVASRVQDMMRFWQGPFLNPHRIYLGPAGTPGPGDLDYFNSAYFRLDFPMDPWGSPYRFYSPLGVIGSAGSQINPGTAGYSQSVSDGIITSTDPRNFDRYAVVSYGRDGLPQTLSINSDRDDIVYVFGHPGVESTFALRP